jgi:hypothetical protein
MPLIPATEDMEAKGPKVQDHCRLSLQDIISKEKHKSKGLGKW